MSLIFISSTKLKRMSQYLLSYIHTAEIFDVLSETRQTLNAKKSRSAQRKSDSALNLLCVSVS